MAQKDTRRVVVLVFYSLLVFTALIGGVAAASSVDADELPSKARDTCQALCVIECLFRKPTCLAECMERCRARLSPPVTPPSPPVTPPSPPVTPPSPPVTPPSPPVTPPSPPVTPPSPPVTPPSPPVTPPSPPVTPPSPPAPPVSPPSPPETSPSPDDDESDIGNGRLSMCTFSCAKSSCVKFISDPDELQKCGVSCHKNCNLPGY